MNAHATMFATNLHASAPGVAVQAAKPAMHSMQLKTTCLQA